MGLLLDLPDIKFWFLNVFIFKKYFCVTPYKMDLDCVSGKLKSIAKDGKVDYLNLGTQANEFSLKTDALPLP